MEEARMYTATYSMEDIGDFDTFAEAFKAIYDKIQAALDSEEGLCWQLLETTIWIKTPEGLPVAFYDARDRMCKEGFLVNGKWVA